MIRQMVTLMIVVQAMGLSILSFASSERSSGASARMEARMDGVSRTQIVGILSCDQGDANDGAGCDLKLTSEDGKAYTLSHADSAMRLYQDGQRKVALHGSLRGDRLDVDQATPL